MRFGWNDWLCVFLFFSFFLFFYAREMWLNFPCEWYNVAGKTFAFDDSFRCGHTNAFNLWFVCGSNNKCSNSNRHNRSIISLYVYIFVSIYRCECMYECSTGSIGDRQFTVAARYFFLFFLFFDWIEIKTHSQ